MYTVKLPPHHNFHLFILVVYQYSYWKFSSVAFSLLVSFSEQFEIVWRSHISITQGVNELTKGKKALCILTMCSCSWFLLIRLRILFHYLTATPWHFEESLVYEILIENSTNNSIMKLLQKKACYQLRKIKGINQVTIWLFLVHETDQLFINHSFELVSQ